jgi:hypothetical protein
MDRRASLIGRTLAELDADPAADAVRRRCAAAATEGEFRAMRGAWTAAVLRAFWRAAVAGRAGSVRAAGAPR